MVRGVQAQARRAQKQSESTELCQRFSAGLSDGKLKCRLAGGAHEVMMLDAKFRELTKPQFEKVSAQHKKLALCYLATGVRGCVTLSADCFCGISP